MVKQRNGRGKLENEGLFIVEAIIDRRRVEGNRLEYLIKWKDYPSSHNTWEPSKSVAHLKEIIAEFREFRLSEGFVDSEDDESPSPPPPLPSIPQTSPTSRKRRRKRKSETSSACHSRMSDITVVDQTPSQTPIPQSTSTTDIPMIINDFDNNNVMQQLSVQTTVSTPLSSTPKITPANSTTAIPHPSKRQQQPITLASINLNNAIKIFAATFNHNGKYFCTLFSDGSKYWISNDNCRKYFPQLLIDYYENCSVFIEPMLEQEHLSPKQQQHHQNDMQQQKFIPSTTEMPYDLADQQHPKDIHQLQDDETNFQIPETSPLPSSIFPEISN